MFVRALADYLLTGRLQHLIVHVTGRCNFRCAHCFVRPSGEADLPLALYGQVARRAGRLFWLDVGGGEPFLREDLVEIVAAFDARIVQIPTNGSMPGVTVETVRRLLDATPADLVVSLSLDGLRETHERIRGAPGSFDAAWETFARLRGLGAGRVSVKVNTVVSAANIDEIPALMREVRRHEPDFHSVVLLRGQPRDERHRLPPLVQLRAVGAEVQKVQGSYTYGRGRVVARILRRYHRLLWDLSLDILEERRQVIPCLAGRTQLTVLGNGDVSSCELLPPVGNLAQKSWDAILGGPALAAQRAHIRDGRCHCTHNCALLDSVLFRPSSALGLVHPRLRRALS